MVNDLRRKFVLVTTILMLAVFGILGLASKIYFDYWTQQDILSIIECISESGLFIDESEINSDLLVEGLTDEEPIMGIIADNRGNVISRQNIGRTSDKAIPDAAIEKMLASGQSEHKADGYIYVRKRINDSRVLIVAVNANITDGSTARLFSRIAMLAAGIFLLVMVTFYLSKYVTLPAKEAMARQKRFISDASHELKTPLGAISINAQALECREENSRYVRNIISETERMSRLVERLLTLSKLEEGALAEKSVLSLSQVAQEMALTYESIAFEKGRTLSYEVEDGIEVIGNEDEIRQLFAILLDNAIKNSAENGTIEIACYKNSGIFIAVKNDGEGIGSEDFAHIFDRFYTTDQSRNNGSFGLGLAIAKEIVTRHGGDIRVESIPNKETVFTIRF